MRLSLNVLFGIVVALSLAAGPARAAQRARGDAHRVLVLDTAQLSAGQALPLILLSGEPGPDVAAYDVALFAVDSAGNVGDTVAPAVVLHAVPAPVPEPGNVLMLACGLLLIVPGGWLGRWSRLGDRESLLQRRLS